MVRKLFAALILAAIASSANALVFHVAGKPMSCDKLGQFLTMPISDFSGWSTKDFDDAVNILGKCYSQFSSKPAEIEARLREVQSTIENERTQAREQKAEHSHLIAACRATSEYRRYASERGMVAAQLRIKQLEDMQKREQEYVQASGVRNLANERNLGVALVETRHELESHFEEYKRAGGTAANPQTVSQTSANPCSRL